MQLGDKYKVIRNIHWSVKYQKWQGGLGKTRLLANAVLTLTENNGDAMMFTDESKQKHIFLTRDVQNFLMKTDDSTQPPENDHAPDHERR
jgi:hypothetical protein